MKRPFSALLLAAGLATAAGTAHAQSGFAIGPRLGANLSTVSVSGDNASNTDPKSVFGAQVGLTLDLGIGSNLSFQPSLLYAQKGFKVEERGTDSFGGTTVSYTSNNTAHINYLELPLNFVYTSGGDHGFQVFAGPYLAAGVGGKVNYDYTITGGPGMSASDSGSYGVEFTDQEPSNSSNEKLYVRKFDAGLNGGIGYRQGPVQLQLAYGLGLGNLIPKDSNGTDSGDKARNRGLQLSANYFFGSK